eukprot:3466794-Ditylum_brightwellii.AAC.1
MTNGKIEYIIEGKQKLPFNISGAHLHKRDFPDVSEVPLTPSEYQKAPSHLTKEQCQKLMEPDNLDLLQQEFLSWHHSIDHLPKADMRTLIQIGVLPR